MVEDLKELRNKLDRLIEKYEKEAQLRGDDYRFEHDPRLSKDLQDMNVKDKDKLADGMEGCTVGNDYY